MGNPLGNLSHIYVLGLELICELSARVSETMENQTVHQELRALMNSFAQDR